MKRYTYREVLRLQNSSFQQLVRFSNALYGQDPAAPRSGGVPRTFDADQVFELFLMGRLVGQLRFGIREAAKLVRRVTQEMEALGLLPSQRFNSNEPMPRIILRIHPGPALEFRQYDFSEPQVRFEQEPRPDGLLHNVVCVNEGPYTAWFWPDNALSLAAEPYYQVSLQNPPMAEVALTDDLRYVLAVLRGLGE
jgi:hypothetical protein